MPQSLELHFDSMFTSRRAAKKSKRGCRACKLRKVKCDEIHPVCGNCRTYFSNRVEKCDYGPSPLRSQKGSVESLISPSSLSMSRTRTLRSASSQPQHHTFHARSIIPGTVGLTTLDPFNTQLKSKLPAADKLLHHYLSTIIGKCLPRGYTPEANPLAQGFWPLVQSDNLLLHVMLQVSAFDLEWQKGEPDSFQSKKYAKLCIDLLRDRVQDPVYGTSDQTIGAVATLATLEYGRRNMMTVRTHIAGLKKMVAVRGGFEKVRSSSPATAALAFWFSLLLTFEPQFPLGDPVDLQETSQWLEGMSTSSRESNFLNFEDYGVHQYVSAILLEVRNLSRYFPTLVAGKAGPLPAEYHIHSKVCSILGRLLQYRSDQKLDFHASQITQCCCLAASIFLFLPFENHFPDPTLLLHSLVHKLQTSLASVVLCSLGGNELLTWLLSVGGVASLHLPTERDWFISHLAESAAELELKSWSDMNNCLKRVLWVDAIDDTPFVHLWEDVLVSVTCLTMQEPFSAVRY